MPEDDDMIDPALKVILDLAAEEFCADYQRLEDELTVRYWSELLRRAEKIQAPGPQSLAMDVARKQLEIAKVVRRDRPMVKKAEGN